MTFPSSSPFSGIVDLYWRNSPDFHALYDAGVRCMIHRAGQVDPSERTREQAIYNQRKGLWLSMPGTMWGMYYLPYYVPFAGASGAYSDMLAYDADPTIKRFIDWEPDGSGDAQEAPLGMISTLAGMLRTQFVRWPVLYGSRSTLDYGTNWNLDQCDRWFAQPNDGEIPPDFNPVNPPPGNVPLWQFSSDGTALNDEWDGSDFSAFNGSLDDLRAWWIK